jgi:hypothetical protein
LPERVETVTKYEIRARSEVRRLHRAEGMPVKAIARTLGDLEELSRH